MTINEAIAEAVSLVGEGIGRDELKGWLCEIECSVIHEIAETHEGGSCPIITPETEGDHLLFAPDPYSRLYVAYLVMKSDLSFRDTLQYENSASVFAESYRTFADWYNRAYMPLGEKIRL